MQQSQTEKLKPVQLSPLPETPTVSVLISNYNYARYIGETIESVLCQTYPHFEIIVCDDGSTDNSCEIIETYVQKDNRIKLIRKKNAGVAIALNRAYEQSKGEIVCILDADDLWINNKLQKVIEAFKCNPKSGFVIHNVVEIDGQGNYVKLAPKLERLASGWMAPYALANGGLVKHIPPASALCLRREITNLIFPLNPAMVRNTDSLIYRLAPLITEIAAIEEILSKFRLHGANATSAKTITPDLIERGQVSAKLVHEEQKKFLQDFYGSEIADQLTDQHQKIIFCHECYLLSRLKKESKAARAKAHQRLITHPEFNTTFSWYKPHRWLVQYDLPDVLFTFLFQQIYGQGHLKRLGKWLLRKKLNASFVHG